MCAREGVGGTGPGGSISCSSISSISRRGAGRLDGAGVARARAEDEVIVRNLQGGLSLLLLLVTGNNDLLGEEE